MPISTLTGDEVRHVAPDVTVAEVAKILDEEGYGALAVEPTDGQVSGIVTERDVLRVVAKGLDPTTTTVGDVASTKLQWCDIDATINEAGRQMVENYLRHLLIEDGGRLAGIVSARDILSIYVTEDT